MSLSAMQPQPLPPPHSISQSPARHFDIFSPHCVRLPALADLSNAMALDVAFFALVRSRRTRWTTNWVRRVRPDGPEARSSDRRGAPRLPADHAATPSRQDGHDPKRHVNPESALLSVDTNPARVDFPARHQRGLQHQEPSRRYRHRERSVQGHGCENRRGGGGSFEDGRIASTRWTS